MKRAVRQHGRVVARTCKHNHVDTGERIDNRGSREEKNGTKGAVNGRFEFVSLVEGLRFVPILASMSLIKKDVGPASGRAHPDSNAQEEGSTSPLTMQVSGQHWRFS